METKSKPALIRLLSLVTLVIAIVALLLGGRLFYITMQQQSQFEQFQTQVTALQTQLTNSQQMIADKNKQVEQLQNNVDQLMATLNEDKQADRARHFRLDNIEQLVRLANQVLLLEHDALKAQSLLEQANGIVMQMNEPAMHEVQEKIAEDVSALKVAEQVNASNISSTLNALVAQIDQLPVMASLKFVPEDKNTPTTQEPITLADQFLHWLNQYVKIQKHDTTITPLLSAEEAAFIKQHIEALLEQAQWGVLRRQASTYENSLARVQQLVSQYGVKDEANVKAFLATVSELKSINVAPALPDVSAILPLLEKQVAPEGNAHE